MKKNIKKNKKHFYLKLCNQLTDFLSMKIQETHTRNKQIKYTKNIFLKKNNG